MTNELIDHAGSGTLVGNLAAALSELFNPLGLALIRLMFARDELPARLRSGTSRGIPFLAEAVTGISFAVNVSIRTLQVFDLLAVDFARAGE